MPNLRPAAQAAPGQHCVHGDTEFCRSGRPVASGTLIIAFSSLGPDDPARPFEFEGLLNRDDCSVLLVRDLKSTWYHDVRGVEGGLAGMADELAGRAAAHERIICVGYSMGGYAALLFGRLLGAQTILAFVPQTVLTFEHLEAWGDRRWDDALHSVRHRADNSDSLDLAQLYANEGQSPADRQVHIYLPTHGDGLDELHARRLSGHANIVELGQASLVHTAFGVYLRESGALRALIDAAVEDRTPDLSGADSRYAAWLNTLDHTIEISASALHSQGHRRLSIRGTVVNASEVPIDVIGDQGERVRVGARLSSTQTPDPHWREFRFQFEQTVLEPGIAYAFEFDIDVSDRPATPQRLSIALVKDGRFWFDHLGFPSVTVNFQLEPFLLLELSR